MAVTAEQILRPALVTYFEGVKVGVHQGSVLLPLLFLNVLDVISENAREGLMNEILFVDDLVLMSESIENLKKNF